MAIHFEVGDEVVEVWGTGPTAKKRNTAITIACSDGTCTTTEGRVYDRLTGAAIPAAQGYRAIHSAEKYRHASRLIEKNTGGA